MNLNFFSSMGESFEGFSSAFSTSSTVVLLISAVVAFFFALFGFKLFKIFVGFVTGCVGFAIGSLIGSVVAAAMATNSGDFAEWLPIVISLILAVVFACMGYKKPFGLIQFAIGAVTYIASCVFFISKFDNIEDTWFLSCLLLPILVTAIVCWLVSLILSAAVMVITSFGGAYLGTSSLMTLILPSLSNIIVIILALVLGALCFVFQIKHAKKKHNIKDLFTPKKKNKKEKTA